MAERVAGAGGRRIDFHSHSYLSDGRTSPTEMWREAEALDHRALAVTDHLSLEDPKPLLDRLRREAGAWERGGFRPLVGVELTYLPPPRIAETARAARRAGAEIVIVHGESIVERVVPSGTNRAAVESGEIDILAHPGLLTARDAERAHAQGVVLEISGKDGHSLCNGHVVREALAAGAELVVDSDAHRPESLLPANRARAIALGSGVPVRSVSRVLHSTPDRLIRRLTGG